MKKTFVLFALASMSAFAADFKGFIGDSKCGATDSAAKAVKCADVCIKGGAAPVLVTEDAKVYKLDAASKDKAMAFVGKSVTVKGTVTDDTLKIDSIK